MNKTPMTKGVLHGPGLVCLLALALGVWPGPAPARDKAQEKALEEFAALQQRAAALSADHQSSKPGVAKQALADWEKLKRDLNDWAKRNKVKSKTEKRQYDPKAPGFPLYVEMPPMVCFFVGYEKGPDGKPYRVYECFPAKPFI
jgi:hypothetical protein